MKTAKKLIPAALLVMLVPVVGNSQNTSSQEPQPSAKNFLGRWDLTLKAPGKEYPSWIEIGEENGKLSVRMVGRWGHARMLPRAEIVGDRITFASPKEEEGRKDTDMEFEGRLMGKLLVGKTTGPDGTAWTWRGEKAPSLQRARAPQWEKPVTLFNGKDLAGWKAADPAATPSWQVKDGTLVSPGRGSDLLTLAKFEDFKLHIEFNCERNSNSGVYLRGRYEVQIEDDAEPEGPSQRTGGVYGFLAPSPEAPRRPGEWQTYDLTLVGRIVTVVLNGKTIIDRLEIPGITGGALNSHEGLPAPIYLQGSEDGHVAFRNIVVQAAKVAP